LQFLGIVCWLCVLTPEGESVISKALFVHFHCIVCVRHYYFIIIIVVAILLFFSASNIVKKLL